MTERTPIPADLQPQIDAVTAPQLAFLEKLRSEKDLSRLSPEQIAWMRDADFTTLSKKRASDVITKLVECPWAPRSKDDAIGDLPDVADGRYAVEKDDGTLMFYSVKKGTYTVFVDVWASDARYPIKAKPEKIRILNLIKDDPDAGPRFGREIGRCYVCGRTLTDETSRSLGIGPVCRGEQ